ncbi:single-stranded-DNA-specific exonuclease RecJ [Caldicellulosiruptoraceae bacterium PP1]
MIFQRKRWIVKEYKSIEINPIEINYIKIKPQIIKILQNRGYNSKEAIEKFLFPSLNDFHDPFKLPDMDKAVSLIKKAYEKKQKVLIYGDYDCDGIASTYLLFDNLKNYISNLSYYIPNRFNDGYGLNIDVLKKFIDQFDLLITVDCGISAIDEVVFLKNSGKTVIITDHHEPKDSLPNADAIVNPKRKDSEYNFRELAGVGVTFKLLQALAMKGFSFDVNNYLDIVAIGTIVDIMPLIDENRIITKFGLEKLRNTSNIGLKKLIEVAGISNKSELKTNDVSFILGPRLNAAGRISDASLALRLLLSNNEEEALKLAKIIDEENRKRQLIEENTIKDAFKKISLNKNNLRKKVFVIGDKDWHQGVVGIASSKITEKYYRPTILYTYEDFDIAKASARSIKGFNLYDALTKCRDALIKYGGHEHAAGLSLKIDNIEQLEKMLNEIANDCNFMIFKPYIEVDIKLQQNEIDDELVDQLSLLEPYGIGNNEPIFMLQNLKVSSVKFFGDQNQYYKIMFNNNSNLEAISFSINYEMDELNEIKKIDVIGKLNKNVFNGIRKNQIYIIDLYENLISGIYKDLFYNFKILSQIDVSNKTIYKEDVIFENNLDKHILFGCFYPDTMKKIINFLKGDKFNEEIFNFFNQNKRVLIHQSSLSDAYYNDVLVTRFDKIASIEKDFDIAVALDVPSYIIMKNILKQPVYLYKMSSHFDKIDLEINIEFIEVYKQLRNIGFISYDFLGINEMEPLKKILKLLAIISIFEELNLIKISWGLEGITAIGFSKTKEKIDLKKSNLFISIQKIKEMEGGSYEC